MADGSNRSATLAPASGRAGGVDSIAEELAARIEDLPSTSDVVEWAATAATCEREAAERGPGREAALLLHQAGRIHEERLGTAEEFGAVCAFLCSAQASYLIGQNLLLDGGAYPGAF